MKNNKNNNFFTETTKKHKQRNFTDLQRGRKSDAKITFIKDIFQNESDCISLQQLFYSQTITCTLAYPE